MTEQLVWDGQNSIQQGHESLAPTPGNLLAAVSHTLFEPGTPAHCLSALGTVLHCESPGGPAAGSSIVFATEHFANRQIIAQSQCFPVRELGLEASLLIPVVAGILRLMEAIDADLGWTAVVNGDGLIARLTRQVAQSAGARRVLSCRQGKFVAPTEEPLERALSGTIGSVVAIETTSRPGDIQNLMSALPARNTCALYGHSGGGVSAVNFYLDVHRKNIKIIGNSQRLQPQHLSYASEFLRHGRITFEPMPSVQARKGATTAIAAPSAPGAQVLMWG